jgi:hypothetical protein
MAKFMGGLGVMLGAIIIMLFDIIYILAMGWCLCLHCGGGVFATSQGRSCHLPALWWASY